MHFHVTLQRQQRAHTKRFIDSWNSSQLQRPSGGRSARALQLILDLKKEEKEREVEVHVRDISFKVELASHQACTTEYDENAEEFLKSLDDFTCNGLAIYPPTELTSGTFTPKRSPIYTRERELGCGSFGGVDKVIDVSTGAIYARKKFFEPQWGKTKHRQQAKEDWLSQVRRENPYYERKSARRCGYPFGLEGF